MIELGCKARSWSVKWGRPILRAKGTGMSGRSGGTAILYKYPWAPVMSSDADESLALDLSAKGHNWQLVLFEDILSKSRLLLGVYYGHPAEKRATLNDLGVLGRFMRNAPWGAVLGGDFNLSDDDPLAPEISGDIVDVAPWFHSWAPTHHSNHGSTRLDRIFCTAGLQSHMMRYWIDEEHYFPSHSMINVELSTVMKEIWVHVAAPPLTSTTRALPEQGPNLQNYLMRWTQKIKETNDVDELYVHWRATAQRGKVVSPRMELASPLRSRTSLSTRKLINFLHLVRRMHSLAVTGKYPTQQDWDRLARAAKPLGHRYGVPSFEHFATAGEDKVVAEVLKCTLDHYEAILKCEQMQSKVTGQQDYRIKAMQHGGVNATMSRMLSDKSLNAWLKIQRGAQVITQPEEVLQEIHHAWLSLYGSAEELNVDAWCAKHLTYCDAVQQVELPPITVEDLKKALATKKEHSAPGPDSWRVAELRQLPDEAWCQFVELMGLAEHYGTLPETMTYAWMADLAKDTTPVPATSVRPISLTSVVYRAYIAARTRHLQSWSQSQFHKWQRAYVPGRSPYKDMFGVAAKMDVAALRREGHQYLAVVSLDATKAFPSANRSVMWRVLKHHGFPVALSNMVESLHKRGWVKHRYGGRLVLQESFQLHTGVHQGCGASVLGFNALLLPLCFQLEARFEGLQAVVYADDISLVAVSKKQVVLATQYVQDYLNELGIRLNPLKTQVWLNDEQQQDPIVVQNQQVRPKKQNKILGMQLGPTDQVKLVDSASVMVSECRRAAERLHGVRIPLAHKAAAVAGILMPRLMWQPWRLLLDQRVVATLRCLLLKALMPHIAQGARSSAMAMIHLQKSHRLDPLVTTIWSLVKALLHLDHRDRGVLYEAYPAKWEPASPLTTLAWYLRTMGGHLTENEWILECGIRASLYPSSLEKGHVAQWQHDWRAAIRHAALQLGTQQRREFQELKSQALDIDASLEWYRALPPSRLRGLLDVVLTGALLTKHRTMRRHNDKEQRCQCGALDTEVHRYWHCPRWEASRQEVDVDMSRQPYVTQCTGLVVMNSGLSSHQIKKMQYHMTNVVAATAKDHLGSEDHYMHDEEERETVAEQYVHEELTPDAARNRGKYGDHDDNHEMRRHDVVAADAASLSHVDVQHGQDQSARASGTKRPHRQFAATAAEIEALPPHIAYGVRTCTADTTYERKLLSCRVCGGVGGALARQFIKNHENCAGHPYLASPATPTMTAQERRLVDVAVGIEGEDRQSKRRRTLAAKAIMVDTWR